LQVRQHLLQLRAFRLLKSTGTNASCGHPRIL
jgi:hypothetical protein